MTEKMPYLKPAASLFENTWTEKGGTLVFEMRVEVFSCNEAHLTAVGTWCRGSRACSVVRLQGVRNVAL